MIERTADRLRAVIRARRAAQDLRWRQLPRFTVRGRRTGPPTVYHLAPHLPAPSGGVRNIYRHVDILNAAGVAAAVVHDRPGFRAGWFDNDTAVVYPHQITLGPEDLLVVPECYGPGLPGLPAGVRVVLFNQGAYHTFDAVPYEATAPGAPYAGIPGLIGLLTVSQDSAALLRYAFPAIPVHVARPVIDSTVFYPGAGRGERRLAYVPARREHERTTLWHLLRARGLLDDWRPVPIAGRTERQVAAMMRGSAIFLSFRERDGFGLPPAEAMASGCYVVGYSGQGGREFFDPRYCSPVPDGDLIAFARAVEQACRAYDTDPETFAELGRAATEGIHGRYHREGLRDDLLAFYQPLLDG